MPRVSENRIRVFFSEFVQKFLRGELSFSCVRFLSRFSERRVFVFIFDLVGEFVRGELLFLFSESFERNCFHA